MIHVMFPMHYRFRNLLVWLFLYLVVSPALSAVPHANLLVQLFFTAVLFSAVYTIHREGFVVWPAIALMLVCSVLLWCGTLGLFTISSMAVNFLLFFYMLLLVITFSRFILAASRVDAELIAAALCLYFLLGLFWSTVYLLLEDFAPGSFSGLDLTQLETFRQRFAHSNYLSFVTLTTLGYGDITPKTPIAMAFCQAEAIIGQFFTAVLVARLVGIQVAQQLTAKRGENDPSPPAR